MDYESYKRSEQEREAEILRAKKRLCVVDLEATCFDSRKLPGPNGQGWVEPVHEIIEIGAAITSIPSLDILSEFDEFVCPKLNPKLSDFCKTLTSIRQEDTDRASPFPHVLARFSEWVGDKSDVLFASWGDYDKNQLIKDCELHGVEYPFDSAHLNLKQAVADKMGWSGKGLGKALERLGMKFEGTPHRGIDDVRNAVRVARKSGASILA